MIAALPVIVGQGVSVEAAPRRIEVPMMCPVTEVRDGDGALRIVVGRGKSHGLVAGARGDVFAPGDKSGIDGVVARAELVEVGETSSVARILADTLKDPARVAVAGQFSVSALLPADVYRGQLFELFVNGIEFLDNARLPIVPSIELLSATDDAVERRALANMVLAGREVVEFTHELTQIQTRTRWKGKGVAEILSLNDEDDYREFLRFVLEYPGKYIGTSWKISEQYAIWLINLSPPSDEDRYRELRAASPVDFKALVGAMKDNEVVNLLKDRRQLISDMPNGRLADALDMITFLERVARTKWSKPPVMVQAELAHARARALFSAPKRGKDAIKSFREASAAYLSTDDEDAILEGLICLNNVTSLLVTAERDDEALAEVAKVRELIRASESRMKSPMYLAHLRLAEVFPSTIAASVLKRRGQHAEVIALLEPLVARIAAVGAEGARKREMDVLTLIAQSHVKLGNLEQAAALHERILSRAVELDDKAQQARTAWDIGDMYYDRGRYGEASAAFERSAELASAGGLGAEVAKALAASAQALWQMGRLDEALQKHEIGLSHRVESDRSGIAWQRVQMSKILVARGDREKAREGLELALRIYRELDQRSNEAEARTELGKLHRTLKRPDLAEVEFLAARETYRALKQFPAEATALQNIATVRLDLGDGRGALALIEQSIALLGKTGNRQDLISAKLWLGRVRASLGDATRARATYRELMPKDREAEPGTTIDVLVAIADLDIAAGDIDAADRGTREAMALAATAKDQSRTMTVLAAREGLLSQVGDLAGQEQALRQLLELGRTAGDRPRVASTLQRLSWALVDLGRISEAKPLAEESLALARQNADDAQVAWSLNALSRVHQAYNDVREELRLLDEALAVLQKGNFTYGKAAITFNRAILYARLRELDKALAGYDEVARLGVDANDLQFRVALPGARGVALLLRGRHDEAERDLKAARDLARKSFPSRLPDLLIWSARLALERGRPEEAIALGEEAVALQDKMTSTGHAARAMLGQILAAVQRDDEAVAVLEGALARARAIGGATPWEPLYELARLRAKKGARKEAIGLLEEAVKEIEAGEVILGADSMGRQHADKVAVFRLLVKLLLSEGRVDAAFQYLERSKVSELRNFDRSLGASNDPNVALAMELDIQERKLQKLLDEELAASAPNASKIKQLDNLIASTKRKRAEFNESVDRKNAAFDRFAVRPVDLEKLKVPEGILVIAPVVLDDSVVIFAMTKDALTHYESAIAASEVDKLVASFVAEVDPKQAAGAKGKASLAKVRTQAQRLYDVLLRPAIEALGVPKTLVMSPTGSLRYLPFSALHDGERWVIERTKVVNVTALDLENFAQRAPEGRADIGLMAVVDPDGTLPAARVELEEVRKVMNQVSVLEGPMASAAMLRQKLRVPGYEIVHLATHGRLDPKNPELSNIVLADGVLSYADIPTLAPTKTQLVVLSACQTAVLTGGSGMEIAGLAYQFQRAQVHSVLATLWEVDDRATADLMSKFYAHIRAGMRYADALAAAQRALLADSDLAHPAYWAPFILMGTP
jgi:CHAT domain-containing protein